MSWDFVYSWSQILAVVFAAVALVSGFVVNKRQGKEIAQLKDSATAQEGKNLELQTSVNESKTELEKQKLATDEQRERTAIAQRATLELQRLIKEPRRLDRQEEALNMLKEGPKGTVSIVHSDNEEAQWLAMSIFDLVRWGGWTGMPPTPKSTGGMLSSPAVGVEFLVSASDVLGMDNKNGSFLLSEPANTLRNALVLSVPQLRCRAGFGMRKGELMVVVGPKY